MLDGLTEYLTHPALWVAILAIGGLGEIAKKLVLGPKSKWPKDGFRGWRGVYAVTYKAHAMFVGALAGWLLPLPVASSFAEDGQAGRAMFYLGAGALSMIGYATIVGNIKTFLENRGKKLAAK